MVGFWVFMCILGMGASIAGSIYICKRKDIDFLHFREIKNMADDIKKSLVVLETRIENIDEKLSEIEAKGGDPNHNE